MNALYALAAFVLALTVLWIVKEAICNKLHL